MHVSARARQGWRSPAARTAAMSANVASAFSRFPAPLVLEPEFGTQQAARIVGHPPQPGFVGALLFLFGGAALRCGLAVGAFCFLAVLACTLLLFQRLLHALSLLLVGLALGVGVAGLGRCLLLSVALAGLPLRFALVLSGVLC